eukprot:gb/GECH01004537.1/.p1 GENE.gb/GECH01004537.1/~~gb/GECH01004537.1/.p1  ORF type:complete len:698 (+),score=143.92 gb/GECH01004537.1/:1-2094(+)
MGEEWIDITDFLNQLSQEMSIGQMIHQDSFDLRNVISATEVMDPRMDNGIQGAAKGDDSGYHNYTIRELIDLDILPHREDALTLEQQLVILERMLSAQVLFMGGAFLPQTLMTCLYIYDAAAAAQHLPHLYIALQIILKSAAYVLETVQRSNIRDEDEFAPVTFGLDLCHQKDTTELLKEADELVGDIERVEDDDQNVESKIRRFIYIHSLILKAQYYLSCGDVPQAQSLFQKSLAAMSVYQPHASDEDLRHAVGFEPVASHRISSPSPVPQVTPLPIEESKERFTQYIDNMFLLCDVVKCVCLSDFSYFFETFIHSQSNPQVTERSYLMDIFMGGGQNLIPKLIQQAVLLYIDECNIYTHQPLKEQQYQEQFSKWIDIFSKAFVEMLTIKSMNLPAQQREMRFNITSWGQAEQEAEQLDHKLLSSFEKHNKQRSSTPRRYVLSMFTLSWLLYAMELFLLRGFETDIYHYSESITVLWYLDYIGSMRVHNFTSIDKEPLPFSKRKGKKGKRNIRQFKKEQEKQNAGAAPPEAKITSSLPSSRTMLEMRSLLFRGIFRFYAALKKSGHYVEPEFPFGSDKLRFEHRFRPFFSIVQPSPVEYDTYKTHIQMNDIKLQDLINSATEHLETVKLKCVDILKKEITGELITEELKKMMKVAQGNAVSLKLVKSTIQKPAKTIKIPELDFSFHRHFPVIKIKP